ncbi:Protein TRIGALACTOSYLDIACYLGLYCEROL 2, chloroplastic [Glycine soja]
MITNPSLHASTLPSALSSSLITLHGSSVKCMPCLPFRALRKINWIRATSAADGGPIESSPALGSKNPLAVVLDIPRTIWKKTMRPLSDFGFGGRSIWEGGVGLFLVSSAVLFALSLAWLKGFQMRSKFRKYTATFEFDQACGICTGTPVRIRGVTVGDVIRVNPSLRSIEAIVEIEDDKTIIPRNSLVEVNQSGLLMETIIDITPRDPIPTPSAGPLDQECSKEALIVCDREKIKGIEGVSLDKLVGIFTRLGQDVEKIGIVNSYSLAERAASIIEEAKPLLIKV